MDLPSSEPSKISWAPPVVWVGVAIGAILAALLFAIFAGLTDTSTLTWTNTDFSNYWIGSRLVLEGKVMDLFSGHDRYFSHMQQAFGIDYPWHSWSYPPSFLLFIWPLGLLPHPVSMLVFLFVTLVVYLHSVTVFQKVINAPIAVLLLPFIICNLFSGQNGFITAALMLYGLGLRDRSPLLAGLAFGLLTIKPQLGLLIPVLLLFERRWLVIASAGVTSIAMVLISAAFFGTSSWIGYFENTVPYQSLVMTEFGGVFLHMMPPLFGGLRSLGADSPVAMAFHLAFAGVVLIGFAISLFRLKSPLQRSLSLLLASFMISPYTLIYDLGAVSAAAAIWAHMHASKAAYPLQRRLLFSAVAFLPLLHFCFSIVFNVPIAPFLLAAAFVLLLAPAVLRKGAT